jgi:cytochrome c-type biogenesis protein CcmE
MNNKRLYLIGAVLVLSFAAFTLISFRQAITPYVSYEDAMASTRLVQVAGGLAKESTQYDETAHQLYFSLQDPESGKTMRVRYAGIKPGNFEDAVSIVAIGRYQAAENVFNADKLLVKCPSKYQGEGMEEKVYE